ncbi:hypothetical protein BDW22DRAFT_1351611 [Trametopsis cervina]|nr:hypothetical protein BDW22DRAFT_1351611 [Trametopsis cervina]
MWRHANVSKSLVALSSSQLELVSAASGVVERVHSTPVPAKTSFKVSISQGSKAPYHQPVPAPLNDHGIPMLRGSKAAVQNTKLVSLELNKYGCAGPDGFSGTYWTRLSVSVTAAVSHYRCSANNAVQSDRGLPWG